MKLACGDVCSDLLSSPPCNALMEGMTLLIWTRISLLAKTPRVFFFFSSNNAMFNGPSVSVAAVLAL